MKYNNLIDVYKETLKDSKLYINTRSSHWDEWYDKNEKFFSVENLINFRNERVLSAGLDDSVNVTSKLDLYELLEDFDGEFLKKNLPKKNIGNSNKAIKILGHYFDYGIIHHLKWFEKIEKHLKDNTKILEIGGGFGSFARIILKNKNLKYFLIDLPEANLQSNYYLQNHFPEKKIFNYIDFKNKEISSEINKYDIFILPPNTLKILGEKNIYFDFFINTRSFMEMKKETIKNYFNFIQNNLSENGHLLNINRYTKSVVGEEIKFHEYPYDDAWEVIISEKSFRQNHIHFLLTKRNKKKKNCNIKDELNKLSQNVKYSKKKFHLLTQIKKTTKRIIWNFIHNFLLLVIGKDKIRKLSNIFYNMSVK